MVSASLALKISQSVSLAFGIGLAFFPQALMETYKGNTFNGASAVMLKFVAGIAGSNMLAFSSGCGVLARDGVVVAAQSVACLSVGITWIAFAINDSYLATTGQFGDSAPVESVYANSVLFLILGAIALLGWKEAGSHLPAFDSLMPKGKPKMPLLVSSLNLVFFAGVRTASRSPDRRARSMSASAWRTLWHWTVAKPKAPGHSGSGRPLA